jgi:hypothetical protein
MIRRAFIARFGSAAAMFGLMPAADNPAGVVDRSAEAFALRTSRDGPWQPARHPADDWLDERPGKHRMFFDALSPKGADEALLFSSNFFLANKNVYAIDSADLAVVVCLRHHATPFAFNDAMWAKYGAAFADRLELTNRQGKQAPGTNPQAAAFASAIKNGVHFAVCDMASHFFAGLAAKAEGADADAVYKELTANTVGNCHFVAAGIVAVNRAQERGYAIAYVG